MRWRPIMTPMTTTLTKQTCVIVSPEPNRQNWNGGCPFGVHILVKKWDLACISVESHGELCRAGNRMWAWLTTSGSTDQKMSERDTRWAIRPVGVTPTRAFRTRCPFQRLTNANDPKPPEMLWSQSVDLPACDHERTKRGWQSNVTRSETSRFVTEQHRHNKTDKTLRTRLATCQRELLFLIYFMENVHKRTNCQSLLEMRLDSVNAKTNVMIVNGKKWDTMLHVLLDQWLKEVKEWMLTYVDITKLQCKLTLDKIKA
jgi:hypothetical protein